MKNLIITLFLFLSTNSLASEILLNKFNTVRYRGAVMPMRTQSAMERLSDLVRIRKDKEYPIYIVLDSPGGSVISGLNFINFVNQFENIHTICLFCASMATTIQQLVTGKRYANNINIMMFHRAKVGIQGQIEDGELEQRLKLYKRLVREVERDVASRLRMSHKRFKKKIKDEYWTYGKQSKREGIVDEIVDLKCSKTLLNTRNCPLYR